MIHHLWGKRSEGSAFAIQWRVSQNLVPFADARDTRHFASIPHRDSVVSMREHLYCTYILASKSRTLYVGVTADLLRRIFQHKQKKHNGFTARYNCDRLVWFERFTEVSEAIQREKELKGWTRAKKIALIERANPTWEDLSESWFPHLATQRAS